ncbi:MAG: BMP family ABC transporter substrate-binding protein, partial [Eubacteriaceae bacterium]|nr:BMP family ABC transporter substrate-binding protein [Eubacteriaceae bacterium]
MKKLIAILLTVCLVVGIFAGCGGGKEQEKTSDIKVGFIFLHDDKSTYDLNFMEAAKAAQAELGLSDDQVIFVDSIDESVDCYNTAVDLVDQGCSIIFADSFGHEEWMIKAAKEFPDVQFSHATGVKAHTEGVANFHNAFATIFEGRFLAGVAAGMKLNEMIEAGTITPEQAVIGYVGAFPYAEVVSGYTSFFLGARYICPSATMLVDFTNSWYAPDAERDVANALMDRGCVLISQHADSMGAPSACEARNVPNISYNVSTKETCPNTYIIASKINWTPYMVYMIKSVMEGKEYDTDWCGTIATGSVELCELNEAAAAPGTAEKIEEVKGMLMDGSLKVFDTATFTVGGEPLTTYLADVDDAGDFVGETEVVSDGYFHESEYRSAPYFDVNID